VRASLEKDLYVRYRTYNVTIRTYYAGHRKLSDASKGCAMMDWMNQTIVRIAELENELRNLRLAYVIEDKRHQVVLADLNSHATKARDAAVRSARAAADSVVAAKQVLLAASEQTNRPSSDLAATALLAAEAAAEAARDAAATVAVVLEAAARATTQRADLVTIQVSMAASLAAIRAAEAAAEVSRLAQEAFLVVKKPGSTEPALR